MTKQEAEAILNRRHENYWGGIQNDMARLDGSFTLQELEAALFLLKGAVEPSAPTPLERAFDPDDHRVQIVNAALHAIGVEPLAGDTDFALRRLNKMVEKLGEPSPLKERHMRQYAMEAPYSVELEAGLRFKPVLERASNTQEGWAAEMEQAPDGEWVHISAVNRPAD